MIFSYKLLLTDLISCVFRLIEYEIKIILYCTVLHCTVLYCTVLVQVLAWAVLVGSVPASLVATPPSHQQRSPFLCLALLAAYNLLSLSYEVREATSYLTLLSVPVLFVTLTLHFIFMLLMSSMTKPGHRKIIVIQCLYCNLSTNQTTLSSVTTARNTAIVRTQITSTGCPFRVKVFIYGWEVPPSYPLLVLHHIYTEKFKGTSKSGNTTN